MWSRIALFALPVLLSLEKTLGLYPIFPDHGAGELRRKIFQLKPQKFQSTSSQFAAEEQPC